MLRRNLRARVQVQTAAIGVSLLIIIILGIFVLKPASVSEGEALLQEALLQLEQMNDYELVIVETAPGYNLYFQGQMEKGVLGGLLPDYNLEVTLEGESLMLREAGTEEWKTAAEKHLEGLASFLTEPLTLLTSQEESFAEAVVGQDINLQDLLCKTVYLDIYSDYKLIKRLFPEMNYDSIHAVNLGVALANPDLTLRQIRLLVEFHPERGERLERIYYVN